MLAPGTRAVGPSDGSLTVKTYREGVAAKAGHDLVIEVTSWSATVRVGEDAADWTIELSADPRSLQVREGLRGVKPLSDKDRAEIRRNIDDKVLRGRPISFRSMAVRPAPDGSLEVEGELAIAGATQPVTAQIEADADGRLHGTVAVVQSRWGIKPYRGLMGALKVRDDVEILIDVRLPEQA